MTDEAIRQIRAGARRGFANPLDVEALLDIVAKLKLDLLSARQTLTEQARRLSLLAGHPRIQPEVARAASIDQSEGVYRPQPACLVWRPSEDAQTTLEEIRALEGSGRYDHDGRREMGR